VSLVWWSLALWIAFVLVAIFCINRWIIQPTKRSLNKALKKFSGGNRRKE